MVIFSSFWMCARCSAWDDDAEPMSPEHPQNAAVPMTAAAQARRYRNPDGELARQAMKVLSRVERFFGRNGT
jgi:hypothetical protein